MSPRQDDLEEKLRDDATYGNPQYLSLLALVLSSQTYLPGEFAKPDAQRWGRTNSGGAGEDEWGSGPGIVERLNDLPMSVDELCHVLIETLEDGADQGTGMVSHLLAALSVTRFGLLEEEAWAVIQLHMTREREDGQEDVSIPGGSLWETRSGPPPPQRHIFNSLLRAMECMLIGMRGKGGNQGRGRRGERGGAMHFGQETVLLLTHSVFARVSGDRYLSGGRVSGTLEGRIAEEQVHAGLSVIFHRGVWSLQIDQIGYGHEEWKASHGISDHQARSLAEVGFHTILGGSYNRGCSIEQVVALLTSLRLLEVRMMLRQLAHVMIDFQAAKLRVAEEQLQQDEEMDSDEDEPVPEGEVRHRDRNYNLMRRNLQDFEDFLYNNSSDLLARPSNTIQSAANLPLGQAPAVTAAAIIERGIEQRTWVRLRNPRASTSLAASFDIGDALVDMSVSLDGNMVALLTEDSQVIVYDILRGHQIASLRDETRRVTCVALGGAENDKLVCGSVSGSITFWTVSTEKKGESVSCHTDSLFGSQHIGAEEGRGKPGAQHSKILGLVELPRSYIHRLAVSPDSLWVLTAGQDATVKVVSIAEYAVRYSLIGHRGAVKDVNVSRDSLYAASASDDRIVRIWCLSSGRCVQQLLGHHAAVSACSFGGKGHLYIASSSADGTVRLWQALAGVVIFAFRGHHGEVSAVALGVDGPQVLSAGDHHAPGA